MLRPALAVALITSMSACDEAGPKPAPPAPPAPSDPVASSVADLEGPWRATLASPGGPLPFGLELLREGDTLGAIARNGPEQVEFSSVTRHGSDLVLRIDTYDSEIRATQDGDRLVGTWTKTTPQGPHTMPFEASRGDRPRFSAPVPTPAYPVPATIDGNWSIVFTEDDGQTFVGQGVFETKGDDLRGTVLTDTGDYRYLEGRYQHGTLELSCFDGGHAFLFRATVDAEGRLRGDFWSRGAYHATWTADAMAPQQASPLADPYRAVELSPAAADGRFQFSFPDLNGNPVTDRDPRFVDKVVLIDIFGTWCPNCNDYAPLLARWHRRYHAQGLEIVGLAFEMTGDVERDRKFVGKYAQRYGLEFPLLLAGTSDKSAAAATLRSLDEVESYPTTIFVGRDGRVQRIHSGFAGPATGAHHRAMVAEMEQEIEALLAAPTSTHP